MHSLNLAGGDPRLARLTGSTLEDFTCQALLASSVRFPFRFGSGITLDVDAASVAVRLSTE